MKFFKQASALLLGILLISGLTACSGQADKSATAVVQADTAKIFAATFPDLEGQSQPLKQWQGKILVLNFWAPWCPPCRAEIPDFIALQEKYRAQGVVFVGLALDQKDKVQAFSDEIGINYPILLGESDAAELGKLAGNRLGGLPFTAIFAQNGDIVSTVTGELKREQLEATLKGLI
ncbi:MAG: TlpA family protein disulfide reductase [Gammaproteobacteria bacterium]|nr:TlpA family protein disulfide reductase [Gammaproteobacteria bacterium]MBU1732121.1 TlpA family protein disulfide reductase [Gammaproteobacteria bacterium]MBU1893349.1 TlpA family protein disulfide reductase [Gammaproteobacteria bacterium]